MRSGTFKIWQKSSAFSSHGKHAKIDPRLLNPAQPPSPPMQWFASVKAAFDAARRRG